MSNIKALAAQWRQEARTLTQRANELGDCPAGLQLFTEATTLDTAADQLLAAIADDAGAAVLWRTRATELRDEAGSSAASQNKRRRALADQLTECADELERWAQS